MLMHSTLGNVSVLKTDKVQMGKKRTKACGATICEYGGVVTMKSERSCFA